MTKLLYTEQETAEALAMTTGEVRIAVAHGLLRPFYEPVANRVRFHARELRRFALPGLMASQRTR